MVGLVARERAEYLGHIAWSADGAYCLEHIILNIYCLEHIHEQVLPAALLAHPSADTRAAPPWPEATLPRHITTHTHSSRHKAIGQTESKPVQATVTSRAWSSTAVISEQASARRLTAAASSRARRAAPGVAVTLDSSRSAVADSHELVPETYRLAVRPKAPKARFED